MPEGPELHLSSEFINKKCAGKVFTGHVQRNPIHKCADVDWDVEAYTISASSRGKELKIFLQEIKTENGTSDTETNSKTKRVASDKPKPSSQKDDSNVDSGLRKQEIVFNFGMTGKFEFTCLDPTSENGKLPKHAHLTFFTKSEPQYALSFVDARRFGKWRVGAEWSSDRGPCCMYQYPQFRYNVLTSLSNSAFNKPLCEVLLNQKYFNGIGNYLRAEICYRAKIPPFVQARTAFADLKADSNEADILTLCNIVPLEVVDLGMTLYLPEDEHSEFSKFTQWLQCYYKPGMKNITDHNGRTMWYSGDPGSMVPKDGGKRKRNTTYDKKLIKNAKKAKASHKGMEEQEEDQSENKTASIKTEQIDNNKKEDGQSHSTTASKGKKRTMKVKEECQSKNKISSKSKAKQTKAKGRMNRKDDQSQSETASIKVEQTEAEGEINESAWSSAELGTRLTRSMLKRFPKT